MLADVQICIGAPLIPKSECTSCIIICDLRLMILGYK